MEAAGSSWRTWAAAAAVLVGALVALAALLDLGPFEDDELSARDFVAQGDALCRDAHEQFEDAQGAGPPQTASQAEDLTDALIAIAEEERDALADLEVPAELSEPVERYLEARDRGIDALHDGLEAAKDADPLAYETAQAELAATQLDPRFHLARDIGFHDCSAPLVKRAELERQSRPPEPTDLNAPPQVNNPPASVP